MKKIYKNNPKRAAILRRILNQIDPKFGVEIGVWRGETFFYLMQQFPNLKLVGIDVWLSTSYGESDYSVHNMQDYNYECVDWVKKYYPNATIITGDCHTVSQFIANESIDFVFIDGDHREKSVYRDICDWHPKVRKGGFVTGHDMYHHPGVEKAVRSFYGDNGWEDWEEHIWKVTK